LLGPFVTAWVRTHGGTAAARKQARRFLDGIEAHLREACLGQVSEVFDAEPPHRPGGCPAQAGSVAEGLRAPVEGVEGRVPAAGKESAVAGTASKPGRGAVGGRRRTGTRRPAAV